MCKKNSLANAFNEFIIQRICEIEKVKNSQTDFIKNEDKIADLKKILAECAQKNGVENILKDFINLQMGQNYELYNAIYAQGFSDALQLPNITKQVWCRMSNFKSDTFLKFNL